MPEVNPLEGGRFTVAPGSGFQGFHQWFVDLLLLGSDMVGITRRSGSKLLASRCLGHTEDETDVPIPPSFKRKTQ